MKYEIYVLRNCCVVVEMPVTYQFKRKIGYHRLWRMDDRLPTTQLKTYNNNSYSIGIDPEDDIKDPELMKGLEQFFEEEMTEEERRYFLDNTIRIMVNRALHLKRWRPPKGLMFSLQQQSELEEKRFFINKMSFP